MLSTARQVAFSRGLACCSGNARRGLAAASRLCRAAAPEGARSVQQDEEDGRWSRKLRQSKGESPAGMWREAANIGRQQLRAAGLAAASAGQVAGGGSVLDFGKYSGLTYADAWAKDPAYCEQVLRRSEGGGMDEDFVAFAEYVRSVLQQEQDASLSSSIQHLQEADSEFDEDPAPGLGLEKVEGGKHAGSTFSQVFETDQEYCTWLVEHHMMSPGARGSHLWPFVAYILYRWRQTPH
eukprot:TRINITY_DN105310_c0_g1_i1.p2 TRINITY_DN105310_c0_g1~~TRINITY_DN105310_c0_g1_i1.p2  ORF type:complete len:238 (-),score=53.71 TRINITY_DN105310_c0_g1_i1:172-885(-)